MGVQRTVALASSLALASVAEERAGEAGSWTDWLGGCALLIAGIVAATPPRTVGYRREGQPNPGERNALSSPFQRTTWPGVVLVLAGLNWFATTAFPAARLTSELSFAHRGLVVHAVLLAALSPWSARWLRALRAVVVVVGYASSLGDERPLSAWWITTAGVAAMVVLLVAAWVGEARWRVVWLASVGITTWMLATGVARVHGWGSPDARFQWYCVGIALSAATVAVIERRRSNDEAMIGDADIVRDGGRADLLIGFRDPSATDFYDADGRPWTVPADQAVVRVDLGDAYGDAIVARRSGTLDSEQVRRELSEGLRLLATNRRALRETRARAAEVSASRDRIRAAEERAASEIAIELNRQVVRRLDAALAVLADDDSEMARGTRVALTGVIDEVLELADGLSPRLLARGLPFALRGLAMDQPVPVSLDIDDVELDSARSAAMYFVAAECLTNASRHASASSISLLLHGFADHVQLVVVDDGDGGAHLRPGGGLAGVERRVDSLGGTLDVTTSGGGGTVVTARLPRRADASLSRP